MITAVDTSILLDVFKPDPQFGRRSLATVRSCSLEGRLVCCDVVWAETASFFASPEAAADAFGRLGVEFDPLGVEAAAAAGQAWSAYRSRGGARERVVADFLIGAHAARQAERLLTRDRGFYRSHFSNLEVLDPSSV